MMFFRSEGIGDKVIFCSQTNTGDSLELIELYFDGGCWPNPGPKGCWKYLICVGTESYTDWGWINLEQCTNNIAEYYGLIELLKKAKELNLKDITIYGDSKLVINQINGKWHFRKTKLHLKELAEECWDLLKNFDFWKLKWVPREENIDADELYDERHSLTNT